MAFLPDIEHGVGDLVGQRLGERVGDGCGSAADRWHSTLSHVRSFDLACCARHLVVAQLRDCGNSDAGIGVDCCLFRHSQIPQRRCPVQTGVSNYEGRC